MSTVEIKTNYAALRFIWCKNAIYCVVYGCASKEKIRDQEKANIKIS